MATIEVANVGFRLAPLLSTSSFDSKIRRGRLGLRKCGGSSCTRRVGFLRPLSCSLVNEQQKQGTAEVPLFNEHESALIEALIGIDDRGRSASPKQMLELQRMVRLLEGLKGVPQPTSSSLIEGRWQLLLTIPPRTASVTETILRDIEICVGSDGFKIFLEVYLRTNNPRVSMIACVSNERGEAVQDWTKVEAAVPIRDGKRIFFKLVRAAWKVFGFEIPFDLSFELREDNGKGWLDITYLSDSGNLCISRGNMGTVLVLQKKTEPRQRLLAAIAGNTGVREAIDECVSLNEHAAKGERQLLEGKWEMIWSSQREVKHVVSLALTTLLASPASFTVSLTCAQRARSVFLAETDSWLENAANGLMGMQIVRPNGKLKFLVNVLLGFQFSIDGTFVVVPRINHAHKHRDKKFTWFLNEDMLLEMVTDTSPGASLRLRRLRPVPVSFLRKSGANTYDVTMDDAAILVGKFGIPVKLKSKFKLELLYGDTKIRITRGYNGIIFVHRRVDG